jgi:AbrB family looped-hinge helix DNA binding protein
MHMSESSSGGMAEAPVPFSRCARLKVGPDGRILIPADLRRAAGLEPGAAVMAELKDGELRLSTWGTRLRRIQDIAAKYKTEGKSVVDEFIAEKRSEAARE